MSICSEMSAARRSGDANENGGGSALASIGGGPHRSGTTGATSYSAVAEAPATAPAVTLSDKCSSARLPGAFVAGGAMNAACQDRFCPPGSILGSKILDCSSSSVYMLVLLIQFARAVSPDHPTPRPVPPVTFNLPFEKVQLKLDPLAYRSSSQGPIMREELEPATAEDYADIENVIERATRTHGWAPIIPQYKRSMQWAWKQWEFTITERLWKVACTRMLVPFSLLVVGRWLDPSLTWWSIPKSHRFAEPFLAIANGWNYMLTLATFVVTFFVGHSHDFWRKSYGLTRSIQGRLNVSRPTHEPTATQPSSLPSIHAYMHANTRSPTHMWTPAPSPHAQDLGLICGSYASRTSEGCAQSAPSSTDQLASRSTRSPLLPTRTLRARAAHPHLPYLWRLGRSFSAATRSLHRFSRRPTVAQGLERGSQSVP